MLQLEDLDKHIQVITDTIARYPTGPLKPPADMVDRVHQTLTVISDEYPKIGDLLRRDQDKKDLRRRAEKAIMARRAGEIKKKRAAAAAARSTTLPVHTISPADKLREFEQLKREAERLKREAERLKREEDAKREALIIANITAELKQYPTEVLTALKAHAEAQLAAL
jgi:hypothetical protein